MSDDDEGKKELNEFYDYVIKEDNLLPNYGKRIDYKKKYEELRRKLMIKQMYEQIENYDNNKKKESDEYEGLLDGYEKNLDAITNKHSFNLKKKTTQPVEETKKEIKKEIKKDDEDDEEEKIDKQCLKVLAGKLGVYDEEEKNLTKEEFDEKRRIWKKEQEKLKKKREERERKINELKNRIECFDKNQSKQRDGEYSFFGQDVDNFSKEEDEELNRIFEEKLGVYDEKNETDAVKKYRMERRKKIEEMLKREERERDE